MKNFLLLSFLLVFFNILLLAWACEDNQEGRIKPLARIALFDLRINPKNGSALYGEVNAFYDSVQWITPAEIKTFLLTIEPQFWPSLLKKSPVFEDSLPLDIPIGFAEGRGLWKTLSPDAQAYLLFRFGKWILWLEENSPAGSSRQKESTQLVAAEIHDQEDPTPVYFHYFQGQYPKIKSVVPFRYIDPQENREIDCIGMLTENNDKSTLIEAFELESQERIIRLEESELSDSSPDWEWLLTSNFDFMPVRLSHPKDISALDIPLAVSLDTKKTNCILSDALVPVSPKKGEIILIDQKQRAQVIKDTEGSSLPRLGPDGTIGWIQKNHLVLYRFGRVFQYFPFEGSFSLNWCFSNHGKETCLYSRKPLRGTYRRLMATNLFLYWFTGLKRYTDLFVDFEEVFSKYDTQSGELIERINIKAESSLDQREKLPLWAKALKALNQFYFE
ncbi:hypothetical protein EM20IM_06875 [Candidatus Methylacidiphilum infernorum]|uniref:Lipoprotein n=1 Tax=Candidatus Methylacidiphilum infernorum TaxID=511746 RepID=A0ABX7PTC2_9BACT|nr:hypothetical protein [Candidatus Methylacidiphilum infernorum]QSR86226.1 hypothetical protein EM20IM_06875 [Candidatus Methylacidiphilum infernorum]